MEQEEEEELQVLEEEQQQEKTEGAGDLVGGGVTEERLVGTMAFVDPRSTRTGLPSSIPEVQGALEHATV